MDNNKIVDNLNFIKISFKEFIHKIIVPKKFELSGKEIKNDRLRMKTCLGAKTGSKKPRKSPKGTQTRKNVQHPRAPIGTFGVPNGTLKVPNWLI